ncbi:syntaxin-like protein [Gymnopilus junonius]|uniref:Syntaxin-like protein n=1 Tax=Gymnopilus junonius TaxID=109634 RepID=A0A9P5NPJ8_GYMJU|nr:syntaxin-like protein [Gymnopilus junonius]
MAYRDRLTASRAQRGQAYELSNIPTAAPQSLDGDFADLSAFLAEDSSIQEDIQHVRESIFKISALRTQTLEAVGDQSPSGSGRIEALTSETRDTLQNLKNRISRLDSSRGRQDAQLRNNRIDFLRKKFLEVLQDYQREEQESRIKSRQRIERQLLIVKPDATSEEINRAVDDGEQQVFARALTLSTRYGESRAAYREVEERQEDLKRVERTLAELAQLFTDMATIVEQHDPVIKEIEATAADVNVNTEKGLENTEKAVKHARSYRRGRWICFFVFLVLIAVLALILGLVFGLQKH